MRVRTSSVMVLALVVAACGGGAGDLASDSPLVEPVAVEESTTAEQPPTAPSSPAAVPGLLDFTADAVEGGQVVGAEFAGQALAIWFWAPW